MQTGFRVAAVCKLGLSLQTVTVRKLVPTYTSTNLYDSRILGIINYISICFVIYVHVLLNIYIHAHTYI